MTRQQAIKAKCIDCIYCQSYVKGDDILLKIENCQIKDCPLYEYRPLTAKTRYVQRMESVKVMNPDQRKAHDKRVNSARKILHNIDELK